MIRILLPLGVIAALLFAPLISGEVSTVGGVEKPDTRVGMDYVGNTLGCLGENKNPISEGCRPAGGSRGFAVLSAVLISGLAAGLGVLGLLPFLGRLTSVVTVVAGLAVLGAISVFSLATVGPGGADDSIQWGSYLAGGGGLLTLISGLAGMRGR